MKNIKLIIIGLAVVLLAVTVVYLQTQNKSRYCSGWHKGGIFKELNLTQEQKDRLQENRRAQGKEMMEMRTAIKGKYIKLQEDLKNPAVTKATVESLVNEIKSLQAQLIEHRINGIFAVKEILTPQQFVKFQQMTEERRENIKERFKNRRERRLSHFK